MASIFGALAAGKYRLTVEGPLTAGDLKHLERACGQALEQKLVPLELNLENVSSIDDCARAYLERLRSRGADVRDRHDKPRSVDPG